MTKTESKLSALYAMSTSDSGTAAFESFFETFADHVQEYSEYDGLATGRLKAIVKKLDNTNELVDEQAKHEAQSNAENELIDWIYDCPLYYDFFEDSTEKTTDELKCMAIFLRAVVIPEYEDEEDTESLCDTLRDVATEWENL